MFLQLMFCAFLGTLTLAQNQTGFMFNIKTRNESAAVSATIVENMLNVSESPIIKNISDLLMIDRIESARNPRLTKDELRVLRADSMPRTNVSTKVNVSEVPVSNNTGPGWAKMTKDELYSWARMLVQDYEKAKRVKREGFGPWEAQETWTEKGESTILITVKEIIKTVSEVASEMANETRSIIDAIEHPITFLLKTKVGTIILVVIALCLLAVIIIAVGPICRALVFVLSCIWKPFSLLANTTCCITLWSLKPIRKIRNHFIEKKKLEKQIQSLRVYTHTPGEEIELLTRTYSNVMTDDIGAYMLASDNHRVYFKPATAVEDILTVRTLAPPTRETGVGKMKETVLTNSKLYKAAKLPDFQGQFDVDGNVIGHFSRIRFQGYDCLITAYHVLEYNRTALIRLRKGEKLVDFNGLENTEVLAASLPQHLDYVIIRVPSHVFGALGIKIGTFSTRVMPREAVCIYQLFNGNPCVSTASIKLFEQKPWHVAYGASTTVGTSGAPILDTRGSILGIHLEHDSVSQLNVGVVPPVFRDSRKESPTNEDLMQHQRRMMWEEYDEEGQYQYYDDAEEDEYDDDGDEYKRQRYDEDDELEERYLTFARGKNKNKDWESDFLDIEHEAVRELEDDALFEQKFGDNSLASFMVIRLAEKARKKYDSKHGITEKESPWTCKRCGCLHYKMQHNCTKCKLSFEPAANRKEVKLFVEEQLKALHDERSVLPEVVKLVIEKKLKSINLHKEICGLVAETLNQGKINVYDMVDITDMVRNTLWIQKNGTWSVRFEDLGAGDKTPIPIEKKSFQHFAQSGIKTAAQAGWERECNGTQCTREEAETHEKGPQSSKYTCEVKARAVARSSQPQCHGPCLEVYTETKQAAITSTGRVKTDSDGDIVTENKKIQSYVPVTFDIVHNDCNHTHGVQNTSHGKDAHPSILKLGAERKAQRKAKVPVAQFEHIADTNLFKGELCNQKLAKVEEECLQQMREQNPKKLDELKPQKETTTQPPKTGAISSSVKRNLRRKANRKIREKQVENYKSQVAADANAPSTDSSKETKVSFAAPKEELPLNSSAPAQTGASATIGSSQNLSQNKPSALANPSASSTHVPKIAPVKSGKRSVKSSQSTESTIGQSEAQKQKK